MTIFVTILGFISAILAVGAYFLMERGVLCPQSLKYFAINGISGVFGIIAVAHTYDIADTGVILIEACWIIISIMGALKAIKKPVVEGVG